MVSIFGSEFYSSVSIDRRAAERRFNGFFHNNIIVIGFVLVPHS